MKKNIIELLRERTRLSFPVEEDNRTFETLLAACAVLLELASADGIFTHDERKRIYALFRDEYQMFTGDIEELVDLTEEAVGSERASQEFTNMIHEQYSAPEKAHLVELLWKIAFADGAVDSREEQLIETLAKRFGMSGREIRKASRMKGT